MKRKSILLLFLTLFVTGCYYDFDKINTNDSAINSNVNDGEEIIPKYEDYNPVEISLYIDSAISGLDKVGDEYTSSWIRKKDIAVFSSLFNTKNHLDFKYFQHIWKESAEQYEDYLQYKTAWHIHFELEDGTVYDRNITHPDDVNDFYEYLEIYLYDSANQPIGTWYSHLTSKDMKENTILTTMKLTAGSNYEKINSDITVSVYTYDSEDDFDSYGNYRGNSLSIVKVCKD